MTSCLRGVSILTRRWTLSPIGSPSWISAESFSTQIHAKRSHQRRAARRRKVKQRKIRMSQRTAGAPPPGRNRLENPALATDDPASLPMQTRAHEITSIDEENRTVEVTFTTGAAVRRQRWTGWDTSIPFDEILEVSR